MLFFTTPSQQLSTQNETKWHPLFLLNDTDITLRSLEGTLYGVHSSVLRSTCGFFATMFTLPQPIIPFSKNQEQSLYPEDTRYREPLDVYESDTTLPLILSLIINPHKIPQWENLDQAENILTIAEKWDANEIIEKIRPTLFGLHFCKHDPLRLYAIARHFDWHSEAREMPLHTFALDLRDSVYSNTLARISSKYLMPLLDLHERRKEAFRKLLNSPQRFTAGNR